MGNLQELTRRITIKNNKSLIQGGVLIFLLALVLEVSAPTPAIPVIYKDRPPMMQVNAKEVAKELLTKQQYSCFTKLIGKESAWKPKAQNPVSSASGIGQLLNSTYARLGMKKSDAGVAQLVATLSYIHRRHVTPCNAWSHFLKNGYY